jgi:hypothetical protein
MVSWQSYNGLSLVVGDSMGALFLFDVTSHALVRVAQLPQNCQVPHDMCTTF